MSHYLVTLSPDPASSEVRVLLQGPGIDPDGRRYVFANTVRAGTFAEAVNFAYEQGLRDGERRARQRQAGQGRLLVVAGKSPESLRARPERWWERVRRGLQRST